MLRAALAAHSFLLSKTHPVTPHAAELLCERLPGISQRLYTHTLLFWGPKRENHKIISLGYWRGSVLPAGPKGLTLLRGQMQTEGKLSAVCSYLPCWTPHGELLLALVGASTWGNAQGRTCAEAHCYCVLISCLMHLRQLREKTLGVSGPSDFNHFILKIPSV